MEHLPVEAIGNILSRLKAARDVVIASITSKKWRKAFRTHLHSLSFNSKDWTVYHDLTTIDLEIIITRTILQTTGLQSLSILMDDAHKFSAALVISWLMYTRATLRELHYNVRTSPDINIIDSCGRHLEVLALARVSIEPSYYHRFSCLRILALSNLTISGPKLCNMMSRLSSLVVKLRLWDIVIDGEREILNFDTPQRVGYPQLTHLSLKFDLSDSHLHYRLYFRYEFCNVAVMEFGCSAINNLFIQWVAALMEKCRSLKKVVIYGVVSKAADDKSQVLANFNSAILRRLRKYKNDVDGVLECVLEEI